MTGIEVVSAQRAQFLPAQRGVVGEREHHPLRGGSDLAASRNASHRRSAGIHGSLVSRGTKPRW